MKKLFSLVLISVLAIGYSRAQQVTVDTILYESFANGIPAGWYNGGTAEGSPNSWVKWLYTTHGPAGAFDNGFPALHSPTAANGFLLFDSDSLDNGGHYNSSTGVPITADGPANAPQVVMLTTTALDVTGNPHCRLSFYQNFLNFDSYTVIGISSDSINWTLDTVNTSVAQGGGNGAYTANPSKVTVDLSPYITGNKLYLSFIMDANYYFWMIDDILVTSLPDYDLSVIDNYGEKGSSGLFYNQIPLSQFTSTDSFLAIADYTNTGNFTQTNINTDFTAYKGNAAYDSAYGSPVTSSLSYDSTITVAPGRQFGANGIGNYTIAVDVESSDSANFDPTNLDSIYFSVTDTVFSVNNTLDYGSGGYFLLEQNEGVSNTLGNLYEVTDADTVTSMTTALLGGAGFTAAGTIVTGAIYAVTYDNQTGTGSYDATQPVISTLPTTVTSAELTSQSSATIKPIVMKMDYSSGNAILQPGVYWAAVSSTFSPDTDVILAYSATGQYGGLAAGVSAQNTLQAFGLQLPYVNMNLGHAGSLLWVKWSRNPTTNTLLAGQPVTFNTQSDASPSAVYSWTFYGDTTFTSFVDTGKTISTSFPVNDLYQVCVTVSDAGHSADYCGNVNVRLQGVGINEVAPLTSVSLVPNPTTGVVNLSAANINGPVSISVINLLGEVVGSYNEDANGSLSKNYDLSALSNGIYLVKITNDSNVVTKKLSISKQ